MLSAEHYKQDAALRAVELVEDGMVVGLGTGSTAAFAVAGIGQRYADGELASIQCVSTSEHTSQQARELGLPLVDRTSVVRVDLAIDGADEIDSNLELIKGLGGALLREKQVEVLARRFVVVADESKMVQRLGERCPLPVEVAPHTDIVAWLSCCDCKPVLRMKNGAPFVTDNGNHIVDCHFDGAINDPHALAKQLDANPQVLAHGLFLNMATEAFVAGSSGVMHLHRRG